MMRFALLLLFVLTTTVGHAADRVATPTITATTFGRSLMDDADATAGRATLGAVIGTNVQAFDPDLAALAGVTSAANALPYFTGSGTATTTTLSSFGRTLIDDADAATARATIGGTYTVMTVSNNVTPTDGATLYIGGGVTWFGSLQQYSSLYLVRPGTITAVNAQFHVGGTLGSGESSSLYIRVNATTDYLVSSSVVHNARTTRVRVTGLNIPIGASDFFEYKWVCPTWATDPSNVQGRIDSEVTY